MKGWHLTPKNNWHYYSGNDLINWALGLLEIEADEVMIP